MKTLFSISIFTISISLSFANIIRVNNTGITTASPPNASVIYTTAQAAHDAAVSGDTIHLESSGVSYGNLTITKKLTLIGNGYFLGTASSNGNANLQALPAPSKLGEVYFASGSANSQITGCTANNIYIGYNPASGHVGNASNILVKRNNVGNVYLYGLANSVSNCIIIQNYIYNYILDGNSGTYSNYLIANNIIEYGITIDGANDSGIIQNNILGVSNVTTFFRVQNTTVRNNILNNNDTYISLVNCTVQNNLARSATSPIGTSSGNVIGINLNTVFEDFPNTSSSWSEDSRFTLKASSPASGTGYNSADIGAILDPLNTNNTMIMTYVLSGIPAVPSIYKLDAPAIINGNTLNVVVSTRSNQ